MKTNLRRSIASLLVVSITCLGLPSPVQASMVSTEEAIAAKRDRIAAVLDRGEVVELLIANGVDPAEVRARVAALTDEEAAQLAVRIDSLPAAGADPISTGVSMLVLAAVLVVAIVVVLVKGIALGIKALSKQTTTDDSRTGAGQEQEVRQ